MEYRIPIFEPKFTKEDRAAVSRTMNSGWIGPGKLVEEFEEKLCEATGSKYVVVTNSGTTALFLAMKVATVATAYDDTCWVPSYGFTAAADAAEFNSRAVKFFDIDEHTLCVDFRGMIFPHTQPDWFPACYTAVFVCHNGYNGEDVKNFKRKCDDWNAVMIEDSACSIGIKNAGLIGRFGILSFSVPKLVTTGQGGAVLCQTRKDYEELKGLVDHGARGWRKTRIHKENGGNFRISDLSASLGISQLSRLDQLVERKKWILDQYEHWLDPCKMLRHGQEIVWFAAYRTKEATKVIRELAWRGIQAERLYRSMNHHAMYKLAMGMPVAEKVYKEVVYLPSSLTLTKAQIKEVCDTVLKAEE